MKVVNKTYIALAFLLIIFSCKKNKEIPQEEQISVFNYNHPQPKDGKLFGVVELGAAGFNSFIVNIDKNLNWNLKEEEYGVSLLIEGMTNTLLVNQKLREYIDKIMAFGLSKKDIYFVVSSGAIKEEITQIISKELKNLGYKVNQVTAKEEGYYALQANLPKEFRQNSFLVDMGSGNTKISYFNSDGSTETLETYGAKYYQKGIENEKVYEDIRKIASKIPLKNRTKCFIIGGVPTKLARETKPVKELYTVLNPNTETFKEFAKKEGKKVQSGLNIYKAIQKETKLKEIIYFSEGNFTIGFLLGKVN